MSTPFPERPFEDEGVLRTDGSVDQTQAYKSAEKQFDPNNPPTKMPRDDVQPAAAVAATGTLTSTGTEVTDGDTVTIGATTYRFKDTMAQANDVKRNGTTADTTLLALAKAINASGVAGTDYFAGTTANASVTASETITSHKVNLTAKTAGAAGNSVATTETSSQLSFGAATLTGGADTVVNPYTHKRVFHQTHQQETSEKEDPSKAAHDASPSDI